MRNLAKHLRTCVGALRRVPLNKRLSKCSDVFELIGIGCLVGAAWWWIPIFGLVFTGVAFIYLGWVTHEPS